MAQRRKPSYTLSGELLVEVTLTESTLRNLLEHIAATTYPQKGEEGLWWFDVVNAVGNAALRLARYHADKELASIDRKVESKLDATFSRPFGPTESDRAF